MSISFLNDDGVINTIRNISTIQRSLLMTRKKTADFAAVAQDRDQSAYPIISEKMRLQIGSLAQKLTDLDKNISRGKIAIQKITDLEDQLIDLREITEGAADSAASDEEVLKKYQQSTSEMASSFNDILQNCMHANEKLFDGSKNAVTKVDKLDLPELKSPQDAVETLRQIDNSFTHLSHIQDEIRDNIINYNLSFQSSLEHTFDDLGTDQNSIESSQNAHENIKYINLLVQYNQGDPDQAYNPLRTEEVYGLLSQ